MRGKCRVGITERFASIPTLSGFARFKKTLLLVRELCSLLILHLVDNSNRCFGSLAALERHSSPKAALEGRFQPARLRSQIMNVCFSPKRSLKPDRNYEIDRLLSAISGHSWCALQRCYYVVSRPLLLTGSNVGIENTTMHLPTPIGLPFQDAYIFTVDKDWLPPFLGSDGYCVSTSSERPASRYFYFRG